MYLYGYIYSFNLTIQLVSNFTNINMSPCSSILMIKIWIWISPSLVVLGPSIKFDQIWPTSVFFPPKFVSLSLSRHSSSLFLAILTGHPHQPSNNIASSSPAIKPTPPSWPPPIPSTLSLVLKSPPTTRLESATPPSSLKFFWVRGPLSLAPTHLFYFIPNWNLDFPKELSLLCSFSSIAE